MVRNQLDLEKIYNSSNSALSRPDGDSAKVLKRCEFEPNLPHVSLKDPVWKMSRDNIGELAFRIMGKEVGT